MCRTWDVLNIPSGIQESSFWCQYLKHFYTFLPAWICMFTNLITIKSIKYVEHMLLACYFASSHCHTLSPFHGQNGGSSEVLPAPHWGPELAGAQLILLCFATKISCKALMYMGVSKNRVKTPQNGWFIMENHIKLDDLGVAPFLETPIWKNVVSFQP